MILLNSKGPGWFCLVPKSLKERRSRSEQQQDSVTLLVPGGMDAALGGVVSSEHSGAGLIFGFDGFEGFSRVRNSMIPLFWHPQSPIPPPLLLKHLNEALDKRLTARGAWINP